MSLWQASQKTHPLLRHLLPVHLTAQKYHLRYQSRQQYSDNTNHRRLDSVALNALMTKQSSSTQRHLLLWHIQMALSRYCLPQ